MKLKRETVQTKNHGKMVSFSIYLTGKEQAAAPAISKLMERKGFTSEEEYPEFVTFYFDFDDIDAFKTAYKKVKETLQLCMKFNGSYGYKGD